MQILIVDDSKMGRELLRIALLKCGHSVQDVETGEQALSALRISHCRLVISDWEMPGMSGLDLCRAIRAGEFPGYVYVILLTARERRDKMDAIVAGADDFMSKPFAPDDLALRVRLAERTIAIHMREAVLFTLAQLIETRGPMNCMHTERIRCFARLLAQDLGANRCFEKDLDAEFIRNLFVAAPLHDIGNATIPDSVLLKPGALSEAEFSIVKTHTLQGARAVESAALAYPESTFFRVAHDIALTHHECYDGTGYPNGLKGDAIPLAGRIVAVADTYDSITNCRNYRAARSHAKACAMIRDEAGKRFDPRIVDAFNRRQVEILGIATRFKDSGGIP